MASTGFDYEYDYEYESEYDYGPDYGGPGRRRHNGAVRRDQSRRQRSMYGICIRLSAVNSIGSQM